VATTITTAQAADIQNLINDADSYISGVPSTITQIELQRDQATARMEALQAFLDDATISDPQE
jgi:hypothetical protein